MNLRNRKEIIKKRVKEKKSKKERKRKKKIRRSVKAGRRREVGQSNKSIINLCFINRNGGCNI